MARTPKEITRRPRGQRVTLNCANPACGRAFTRERQASMAMPYGFCSPTCRAKSPFRKGKGEYVRRPEGSAPTLTPWFPVTTPPSRIGRYRAKTKGMPVGIYIDAWWEDGWWLYDEDRGQRHESLLPIEGVASWCGRTRPANVR